ncbi:MAG: ribosome-binding factor A, partial [Patescibacteria group bacterium]
MFRAERAKSLLTRLVAEFIKEHWIGKTRITVTRVELSLDLRNAIIYVNVNPESEEKEATKELAELKVKLYNKVTGKLEMKFTPRFEF